VFFLGYSRLQKGYQCYSTELGKYLVSTDMVFSETIPFFYVPPNSTSLKEEDKWLAYQVTRVVTEQSADIVPLSPCSFIEHQSTIVPSQPTQSVPARPPIVQVYSRRQEINDTYPTSTPSSDRSPFDPLESLDLPIALRKGTRQCKSAYFIANFVSYDHLSLASSCLVGSLDSVTIPKTVKKEALNHSGWHNAMLEEIHALDKIILGIWWIYPRERK